MTMPEDMLDILNLVASRLEKEKISYMLTGSFASGHYAEPRTTRDLDLVIELQSEDAGRVFQTFNSDFYVDLDMIKEATKHRHMFNMIHLGSNIKIDFIIRKNEPYRILEFGRRKVIDFGGIKVWCVSPEDLILSKLNWAKESFSELQLRDVKSILKKIKNLDQNYLNEWIEKLDLKEVYSKLPNE